MTTTYEASDYLDLLNSRENYMVLVIGMTIVLGVIGIFTMSFKWGHGKAIRDITKSGYVVEHRVCGTNDYYVVEKDVK